MKVLVITADKWQEFAAAQNECYMCGKWPEMEEVSKALHAIDIPDGCVLAVVENSPKPDFSVVKGANGALHAAGIALGQEAMWDNGYRRVIQEVKL